MVVKKKFLYVPKLQLKWNPLGERGTESRRKKKC